MSMFLPAGGGLSGVTSISNSDSTLLLTPNPITGTGTIGINLAHANDWTATQTFSTIFVGITAHIGTLVVSGTSNLDSGAITTNGVGTINAQTFQSNSTGTIPGGMSLAGYNFTYEANDGFAFDGYMNLVSGPNFASNNFWSINDYSYSVYYLGLGGAFAPYPNPSCLLAIYPSSVGGTNGVYTSYNTLDNGSGLTGWVQDGTTPTHGSLDPNVVSYWHIQDQYGDDFWIPLYQ